MANEKAAEYVTVASKLPHALELRLSIERKVREATPMGAVERLEHVATGDTVTIHGCAHPQERAAEAQMVAGYALTPGVPKAFWDQWMASTGKHLPAVKNGLVFAYAGTGNTEAAAKERVKVRSGLERLDPENLPRGIGKIRSERVGDKNLEPSEQV